MKSWLRYALLALVAYGIFLIATLPAAHAYDWFKNSLTPLRLYGLEGSVWSGRAQDAELSGYYRLGKVTWEAHPWTLLLGRIEASWAARDGLTDARGHVTRTLTGATRFTDVTGQFAVGELAPLFTALAAKPEGVLRARLDEIEIDGAVVAARGTLNWENAAFITPQPVTLGAFTMNIVTDNTGVKGTLLDKGGPLKAQGVLTLKPDGNYQFTGSFSAQPGAKQSELLQALSWLGAPGPDGKISVFWSGVWPGAAIKTQGSAATDKKIIRL